MTGWVLGGAEGAVPAFAAGVLEAPLGVVVADAGGAAWTVEVTVTGAAAGFEVLVPHAARLAATAATVTISATRIRAMTYPP